MVYFTTCFSFSMFVYCYVAERLQFEVIFLSTSKLHMLLQLLHFLQSTEIDYAAYQSDWYNWAPRDTKLLLLLMGRARKPLEITAGKFCVFSLGLYCKVRLSIFNCHKNLNWRERILITDLENVRRIYFDALGSQKASSAKSIVLAMPFEPTIPIEDVCVFFFLFFSS